MKSIIIKSCFVLLITLVFFCLFPLNVFAHESFLDVEYDSCDDVEEIDGEDELWYMISNPFASSHISHEVNTIRYYIADDSKFDDNYTWKVFLYLAYYTRGKLQYVQK